MQPEGPGRGGRWVGRGLALGLSFGRALVIDLGFGVRAPESGEEAGQSKARGDPGQRAQGTRQLAGKVSRARSEVPFPELKHRVGRLSEPGHEVRGRFLVTTPQCRDPGSKALALGALALGTAGRRERAGRQWTQT